MDSLATLLLARLQFAANITSHILFPHHQHRHGLVFVVFQNPICSHR
jgi:hypothetical protein